MTGKELLISAQKLILTKLDQTYPTPITLDDREIGFYKPYDISQERNRRASALSDAFTYLKSEGLITYSSADDRIPRTDLKLTPKGVQRSPNPIELHMSKKSLIFETPFETYTSLKLLGEGGSGYVHAVKNSTSEEFALKYLNPNRITTEKLKRFKNEVEFCQRNNHQNIVRLIDTGSVVIDGIKCPFYVMKRYAGTLRSLIGKISPDDSIQKFAQILDGIEAAHLVKVWHRDLKPENVLWDDRNNKLVVADFGIAHFEEEEIYTAVETHAAARLANFQYSAPEQRIRNSAVDQRADIFALGLILNELFTSEVIQGSGYKKIGDLNSSYGYLDDIVETMVQQKPENRPSSIEAIKKELIGRKNEFVAFQKYEVTKQQVVKTSEPAEFVPISIVAFDYVQGNLHLELSQNVPLGWSQEFTNPSGGYSSIMGYEPQRFTIAGNKAHIGVRGDEHLIQQVINYAKQYVTNANQNYVQKTRDLQIREEQRQRAELQTKVAEAELRKNILSKIKL